MASMVRRNGLRCAHSIYTAPARPGWVEAQPGTRSWPVDRYLEEGERTTDWLAKGVLKQHRTVATYVNLLIRHNLRLAHLEEWGPTPGQIAAQPGLADERQRPAFLLMSAQR
jgi:hypothetical protein